MSLQLRSRSLNLSMSILYIYIKIVHTSLSRQRKCQYFIIPNSFPLSPFLSFPLRYYRYFASLSLSFKTE